LHHQVQEIDAAQLQPDEDRSLDARLSTLRHLERVRSGVMAALAALAGEERGASDPLVAALRALQSASRFDPSLVAARDELDDLLTRTRALIRNLEDSLEGLESDPGELDRSEQRRSLIDGLERKYGQGVATILAHRERAAEALADAEAADASGVELRSRERALGERVAELAERVSRGRRQAAAALAPQVEAALRRLALPHARFAIELQPREPIGGNGAEQVVFHFSANLGEPLAALTDVASGGELSRVMLALHAAAGSSIPTLVFDEVDAGLGGRSGRAVGEMLAQLARGRQVLVVTHLAQVAAFADHHLRVDKHENEGRTRTEVTPLNDAERVTEIARMLAGSDSDEAREHARALLRRP
jgi:DNA repair protein RecN (Recombination protein N)